MPKTPHRQWRHTTCWELSGVTGMASGAGHQGEDGALLSGGAMARAHGRQERWGRLVQNDGLAGLFGTEGAPMPHGIADEEISGAHSAP